jgi:hypothetical protein
MNGSAASTSVDPVHTMNPEGSLTEKSTIKLAECFKCKICGVERSLVDFFPHYVSRTGQPCVFKCCTYVGDSGVSCRDFEKKRIEGKRSGGLISQRTGDRNRPGMSREAALNHCAMAGGAAIEETFREIKKSAETNLHGVSYITIIYDKKRRPENMYFLT